MAASAKATSGALYKKYKIAHIRENTELYMTIFKFSLEKIITIT